MGLTVENQTTNRPRDLVRIVGTGCRRIRGRRAGRGAARVGVGESVLVGVARKDRVPLTASRPTGAPYAGRSPLQI